MLHAVGNERSRSNIKDEGKCRPSLIEYFSLVWRESFVAFPRPHTFVHLNHLSFVMIFYLDKSAIIVLFVSFICRWKSCIFPSQESERDRITFYSGPMNGGVRLTGVKRTKRMARLCNLFE